MAAPNATGVDQRVSERSGHISTRDKRETAGAKSPLQVSVSGKSPELRDLLGDYSEQTGSFFG